MNLKTICWEKGAIHTGTHKHAVGDLYLYEVQECGKTVVQVVKSLPAMPETWVQSLGQEDPLEKGMATHSSILSWRIPWTEEPGKLQSMGSQRVGHDWATNTHTHTHTHKVQEQAKLINHDRNQNRGHFWEGFWLRRGHRNLLGHWKCSISLSGQ